MKRSALLVLLAMTSFTAAAKPVLHLDPEMTGAEYRSIFAAMETKPAFRARIMADQLREVLELGKRNLDWIEVINSKRDDQHKLQLTTPELTAAYPIESPGTSNRKIILTNLETLKQTMPHAMSQVIFGMGTLPENPPVDDKTFVDYAYLLNRIYEAASRWLLQEPYLSEYQRYAMMDIRGYYFLNKEADLKNKLQHWTSLDEATQKQYSEWLAGECNNVTGDVKQCEAGLQEAIADKQVLDYHERYEPIAAEIYKSYFELVNPRPEVIWNYKNPDVMEMPFTLPERQDVQDWFKSNVEFYDKQKEVMINYQIDITNLMCSRRGHLQEKHYEELKKHYQKG